MIWSNLLSQPLTRFGAGGLSIASPSFYKSFLIPEVVYTCYYIIDLHNTELPGKWFVYNKDISKLINSSSFSTDVFKFLLIDCVDKLI